LDNEHNLEQIKIAYYGVCTLRIYNAFIVQAPAYYKYS
jgi:hypothetical protein